MTLPRRYYDESMPDYLLRLIDNQIDNGEMYLDLKHKLWKSEGFRKAVRQHTENKTGRYCIVGFFPKVGITIDLCEVIK